MKCYLFENIYTWHESSGNCMNLFFLHYEEESLEILNALKRVNAKKQDFFSKEQSFIPPKTFCKMKGQSYSFDQKAKEFVRPRTSNK